MTSLEEQNKNAFKIYHYADTYHDFGKPNNDRCGLTNIVTNNIDAPGGIVPGSVTCSPDCKDVSGYENKIAKKIEANLVGEYTFTQEEFESTTKTPPIGIIFDMAGGFSSSLFQKPPTQNTGQGLYNINTIANIWDMAQKPLNNRIRCYIQPTDLIPISKLDTIDRETFCFGSELIEDKLREFVQIGNQKFYENEIETGIFNLSVEVLCGTIQKIDGTNPSNETNIRETFDEEVSTRWLKFGKLTKTLGREVDVVNNLRQRFKSAFIDCYTTWNKTNVCNFIFDIKRSMDAGQVEIARYLAQPENKSKLTFKTQPKRKTANAENVTLNNITFMVMSGDILCYTRSRLQHLNNTQTVSAVRPRVNPLRYTYHQSLDLATLQKLIIEKYSTFSRITIELLRLAPPSSQSTPQLNYKQSNPPLQRQRQTETLPFQEHISSWLTHLNQVFIEFSDRTKHNYNVLFQKRNDLYIEYIKYMRDFLNIGSTNVWSDIGIAIRSTIANKQKDVENAIATKKQEATTNVTNVTDASTKLNAIQDMLNRVIVLKKICELPPPPESQSDLNSLKKQKFRFLDYDLRNLLQQVFTPGYDIQVDKHLLAIANLFGINLENSIHQIITMSLDKPCNSHSISFKKMANFLNNIFAAKRGSRVKQVAADEEIPIIMDNFFNKLKEEIQKTDYILDTCITSLIPQQQGGVVTRQGIKCLYPEHNYCEKRKLALNRRRDQARREALGLVSASESKMNIDEPASQVQVCDGYVIHCDPYQVTSNYIPPNFKDESIDDLYNKPPEFSIPSTSLYSIPEFMVDYYQAHTFNTIIDSEELFVYLNNFMNLMDIELESITIISISQIIPFVNNVISFYSGAFAPFESKVFESSITFPQLPLFHFDTSILINVKTQLENTDDITDELEGQINDLYTTNYVAYNILCSNVNIYARPKPPTTPDPMHSGGNYLSKYYNKTNTKHALARHLKTRILTLARARL